MCFLWYDEKDNRWEWWSPEDRLGGTLPPHLSFKEARERVSNFAWKRWRLFMWPQLVSSKEEAKKVWRKRRRF